jgi:arsenate reductase
MATANTTDNSLILLSIAASTAVTLGLLILALGGISGAHFNPAVSAVMLFRKAMNTRDFVAYVIAQVSGAVLGVAVANLMYGLDVFAVSTTERVTNAHLIGEVVATSGLVGIILALVLTNRPHAIPASVGAWIFTAILFTSSTSFANPAVTVGRMFTSSVTGIAPASGVAYIAIQLVGALIGFAIAETLFAKDKS